ncbi:HNH endonuclease family protein [Changpingibacter yushuensis]|uniref:HNH endonuclease family protein n=1 Tax=Changpingibacter yushuensis TaxID=2758440 RepID=UPI00165DD6B2|nr:HNH endonuclease family protein [Changpingibacter yushuensis]
MKKSAWLGVVVIVVVGWGALAGGESDSEAPTWDATSSSSAGSHSSRIDSPSPVQSALTTTASPQSPSDVTSSPAAVGSAIDALESLPVKGRAAKTGYDRDAFGYREFDTDKNGCDTRNDILRRDLTDLSMRDGSSCVVQTGTLNDPYSGEQIAFTRGVGTSNDVQIDHVVALSDAWQKGAQSWDAQTMHEFANDPLNLLAVKGSLNSQKGDGDAATWLPPSKSYRCPYVARQIAVKAEYSLWVTQAEYDAMARILSSCPQQELPAK